MDVRCTLLASGKSLIACLLKWVLTTISGQKLGPGQSLTFPTLLTRPDQSINCYVMCDSIGEFDLSIRSNDTDFTQLEVCEAQL